MRFGSAVQIHIALDTAYAPHVLAFEVWAWTPAIHFHREYVFAFYKFVGNNYQAPEEEGLKGKVYVTFVVEKDGSLTDIKVIRDIGYGTGKEAIRVLKKCPKWTPGEQNGKKVRVLYSLPITIQSAE